MAPFFTVVRGMVGGAGESILEGDGKRKKQLYQGNTNGIKKKLKVKTKRIHPTGRTGR